MKIKTRWTRIAVLVCMMMTTSGTVAMQLDGNRRGKSPLADICTGVLGLTQMQTARLNVLNEGDSDLIVEMVFRAANSTILQRSGFVRISPDEGAFFDLDGATVVGERQRLALYGMVFFVRQEGAIHSPNVTFELFNSDTLETDVVLSAAHR